MEKLTAAKELLAAGDRSAIAMLEELAGREADEVAAAAFLAIAARLRGIDVVRSLFMDPATEPRLARLLLSNYNSDLVPDEGDVRFLVDALGTYLDRALPWLAGLRQDVWDNGAYLILVGLTHPAAIALLRSEDLATERGSLLPLLERVTGEDGDDDLLDEAAGLIEDLRR